MRNLDAVAIGLYARARTPFRLHAESTMDNGPQHKTFEYYAMNTHM